MLLTCIYSNYFDLINTTQYFAPEKIYQRSLDKTSEITYLTYVV